MPFAAAGVDGCIAVDRDGDPAGAVGERAQPRRIDALVREQEVVAEAGPGHADDLPRSRGR